MIIIDARATERFDWDEGNVHKNKLKHDVDTSECEELFFCSCTNQKESCMHVFGSQYIKYVRRHLRIRAIIEYKSSFSSSGIRMHDRHTVIISETRN
jgi:uncharacterized DUF497 family protein